MTHRLLSVCLFFCLLASSSLHAQIDSQALARTGLTTHWRASIGGIGLKNGDVSLRLWTTRKSKAEVFTVLLKAPDQESRSNSFFTDVRIKSVSEDGTGAKFVKMSDAVRSPGRRSSELWYVLEQFKATDTDWVKQEASADEEVAKLGASGARAMAEKLAETYRRANREVEIVSEVAESSYLVAINRNGLITCIDAETGSIYWQNQLPRYELSVLGPGVSDDYVAAVNGNHLVVYGLEQGNLVSTQRLQYVATGELLVWNDRVLVPSAGGRVVSYSAVDPTFSPKVVRLGRENRKTLVQSNDHHFFGWVTDHRLIIAKHDKVPKLWTAVDAETDVPGSPVAVDGGFVMASEFGSLIKANLTSNNSVSWRRKFGIPTGNSPVVGKKHVAIVSQNGLLLMADLETGQDVWRRPIGGIAKVLNITEGKLYAMDQAGKLAVISMESGVQLGRVAVGRFRGITNNISDRILLVSDLGELVCLREIDSEMPVYTTTKIYDGEPATESTPPSSSPGETQANEFSPFELDKKTEEQSIFDPFAG
ncbi:PQQ-binding-like beta-propeller repeat protein [Pirellulaceae bacterium SH449]